MKQKNYIGKKFFIYLFLKIKSLFVTKPKKPLSWSSQDYERAKNWAKTKPHPYSSTLTLWDHCLDKGDSALTLHTINKFL